MVPGTEKPIAAQRADGTEQRLCKSNQTPEPVYTIVIDRSVIASNTTVKCSLYSRGPVEQDLEAVIQEYLLNNGISYPDIFVRQYRINDYFSFSILSL